MYISQSEQRKNFLTRGKTHAFRPLYNDRLRLMTYEWIYHGCNSPLFSSPEAGHSIALFRGITCPCLNDWTAYFPQKIILVYRRNFIEVVQGCIRDLFMNYRFISSLYIVYQTFGGSCLNILLLWRYSKSSNGAIISLCRSSMQLLQAWITGSARVLELLASTVTPELDSQLHVVFGVVSHAGLER
jgi:hypothetical protein